MPAACRGHPCLKSRLGSKTWMAGTRLDKAGHDVRKVDRYEAWDMAASNRRYTGVGIERPRYQIIRRRRKMTMSGWSTPCRNCRISPEAMKQRLVHGLEPGPRPATPYRLPGAS